MVFAPRQFAQSVFGNCDNTPLPPPEASFLFENAQVRNWAQGTRFPTTRSPTRSLEWPAYIRRDARWPGNCIIKMRVGKMGWVEVVVRRPAGSQRWIMQIQNVIHQVAAPVNTLKIDEYVPLPHSRANSILTIYIHLHINMSTICSISGRQLKKCIEEAPWMFTHLQTGDSLLHDRQTKPIPERTVSDIGARGRPLLHREAR